MTGNKISDYLPQTEILAQLAEEASELSQAALKLRRAMDGTNPTPKSVEECRESLCEEYADVFVCMNALMENDFDKFATETSMLVGEKNERWLNRLRERENAPTPGPENLRTQWISTERTLPQNDENVLSVVYGKPKDNIHLVGAYQLAEYSEKEGWIIEEYPEWKGAIVTHWMPLPEPPEEGSK